ncbi:Hypothetical protein SAMN06297229_1893 [Pseudidiomarina planktonica]|uniref:DUF2271 domain-containing protein n=1 Tax=Pseudidiomarina planktonica TaxID=1323738 RepID=A0A1Y6FW25_9GAMM|nr:DUF2271 domain-containing protein [Pseudidiomarina planktonica]RUO63942.1 DUF2271 domain-containing protein [Pseudidiomarina planktonica]SMQ79974.1 Hypothetical protein SAMN06297229_1893 [Pseudidiomarina planktonica]
MRRFWLALLLVTASSTAAAEVNLTVTLPRLNVAEYHAPYVAVWIENDRRQATQVALWYDVALANGEGQEWLKDLRQWWRRGGRSLTMPVDGLSGATKGPGQHTISTQLSDALTSLPAGSYTIMVEAAREVGGREVLRLPIELPLTNASFPVVVEGQNELESIRLHN